MLGFLPMTALIDRALDSSLFASNGSNASVASESPHVRRLYRSRWLFLGLLAVAGAAACRPSVCGPAINDPANRSLRRSILAMGLGEFCKEMLGRNAPLKLNADSPVMGRFYPRRCNQRELDNGDLYVEFDGEGYAWTNVSKKVSFVSNGAVRYGQDYRCSEEGEMYAYFPPKKIDAAGFRVRFFEQPVAHLMSNWLGSYADNFGQQTLAAKLREGFTVIRSSNGNMDFDLGLISLGQKPFHPMKTTGARANYENSRTEVHQNQRDFVGPIVVEGSGKALFINAQLDGASAIDLFVMTKDEGEASLRLYLDYPATGPLAFPPRILSDTVVFGKQYQRPVPVGPGAYYVVFDNTPTAGVSNPPMNPLDDRAAAINYAIQIGDAP